MLTREELIAVALLPAAVRYDLWRRGGEHLLQSAATLDELLVAHVPELAAPARAEAVEKARGRAARALERTAHRALTLTTIADDAFPAALRTVPDPPFALWSRGPLPLASSPAIAVVGSRTALSPTLELAESLARGLASRGLTVVSGLARGVDSAAHTGALTTGRTLAVFGSGVDCVYPPEHLRLAETIASCGALLSEMPPGTPPRAPHFPLRNRIIAGLSVAVVVVEASERSGSLSTARYALEQGREVMVVPGSVAAGRNRGGHALLRDGAQLVESAQDIVEALPYPVRRLLTSESGEAAGGARVGGGALGDALLAAMEEGACYGVDELLPRAGLSLSALLARLTALELDGTVRRVDGGRYLRPMRN